MAGIPDREQGSGIGSKIGIEGVSYIADNRGVWVGGDDSFDQVELFGWEFGVGAILALDGRI